MAEIQDSGCRREFASGAVRDIQEGKGRCDLLPVDIIAALMDNAKQAQVLHNIGNYMIEGTSSYLYLAIRAFNELVGWTISDCLLEVSKHYEDGANKYGERNWEKGISLHSYIDSGIRHFLKYIDGADDERHDRAFVWNMLGAIWTQKHHIHLIDIPFNLLNTESTAHNDSDIDTSSYYVSRSQITDALEAAILNTSKMDDGK